MKTIFSLALIAFLLSRTANAQSTPPQYAIGAENEVTAVLTDTAPKIDGILDDATWQNIIPIDDFIQIFPDEGAEPTQKSSMRIAYDANNLYFGFEFFDTEPEKIRARNLERGGLGNGRDDMMWLFLDTYHDGRNAYLFETNALGTQDDAIISDESMSFDDWQWDGIFRSEGRVSDEGWILEVAIPFRTIRFKVNDEKELTMGVAVQRFLVRTGERSMWPFIPRSFASGIFQVSQYATLRGMKDVTQGNNLEIKPYLITGGQEVRLDESSTESDLVRDAGVDIKYGISSNLTLDVTLNTDFAQVESDNVQLDLTRFNLFFPEKREFFLERSGLFQFGDSRTTETFFSRRIGISNDILAGARLTGQVGIYSLGALNIQTARNKDLDIPASNNSVLRIRADVLDRTTVGAIVTNIEQGDWYNRAIGLDVERRFWGSSSMGGWVTQVEDAVPGESDRAGSAFINVRRANYGAGVAYKNVGKNFNPALGFVRRRDMKRYGGQASYTPQFGSQGLLKSMNVSATGSITNGQDN